MRNVYMVFLAITFAIVVTLPRTGQCQKDVSVSRSDAACVEESCWFSLKQVLLTTTKPAHINGQMLKSWKLCCLLKTF